MKQTNDLKPSAALLQRIRDIDWFRHCGEALAPNEDFRIQPVSTWELAARLRDETRWDDTTLEARNELTVHLYKRCDALYNEWNKILEPIKQFLASEVYPIIMPRLPANVITERLFASVRWNLMNAIMEDVYARCRPPVFFGKLLPLYEQGHLPCGWRGEWPNGSLLVL